MCLQTEILRYFLNQGSLHPLRWVLLVQIHINQASIGPLRGNDLPKCSRANSKLSSSMYNVEGIRRLWCSSLLLGIYISLWLALFLVGSSPGQIALSWIYNILRMPVQVLILFHIFIQWPRRNSMQSLSHTLSCLGGSLILWKTESINPVYIHPLPMDNSASSTACLGCTFYPLNYISFSFGLSLLCRSRKDLRPFSVPRMKLTWVGLAQESTFPLF